VNTRFGSAQHDEVGSLLEEKSHELPMIMFVELFGAQLPMLAN
jgi:hypothetical protein